MTSAPLQLDSPWPHRWAVALVCATFPLIWVGGLVTTYDAGMAVPDWPNTYGYNLFLYPWQTWISGPWGLFIEHGHRLLGSLAGMLAIGAVASAWWCGARKSVRWLAIAALLAVILQGALGGLRVIEDKVQLARLHGCVGPAFFALAVSLAVVSSRRWQTAALGDPLRFGAIERLAIVTAFLAYMQLVLGSFLRHLPPGSSPSEFRVVLFFHLATAGALAVHALLLARQIHRDAAEQSWLRRPALGLAALVAFEICLGTATWVAKYGWPSWLDEYGFAAGYVVTAESRPQAWITTAHVAVGSLILVTSVLLAVRSARLARRAQAESPRTALLMETYS